MPIHPDHKSELDAMIKKYGPEKGKQVFYASKKKQGVDYKKPRPKSNSDKDKNDKKEIKHSFLNGLSVKELEGDNLVIEGYVATNHIDNTHLLSKPGEVHLDDMLPEGTLDSIANQINTSSFSNKLSVHHRDVNPESPVAGAIKNNAKVIDTQDGHKGVWVEATINKAHPEYEAIKSEVEQGMIDGFSIEFETLQSHPKIIGDKEVRVIDNILIGGVGLASRPINPRAQIKNYTYKELLKFKTKGVSQMKETKEDEAPAEKPEEEKVEEKPAEEESKDDSQESKPEEESKEESSEEKEFKEFKEMKRKGAEKEALILSMKEVMKDLEPKDMPRFQSGMQFEDKELKEVKSLVDNYKKTSLECKEWTHTPNANRDESIISRKGDINLQLKEAAKLHNHFNKMYPQGIPTGPMRMGEEALWDSIPDPGFANTSDCGLGTQDFEIKESHWNKMETKGANPFETTTSQISAASHYLAAPELADIYDPVIYNMLNDKTTFYGLLKKVDASKYSYAYGWRAIYGRAAVPGAQAEGATLTPDSTDRIILRQPFKFYYGAVRITGQMIAAAKGQSAVGDIMALEIKDVTRTLLRDINSNLLIGTEDGSNDGAEALGLTYLCEKGSSYTDLYIGVSRNTYKLEGNSESASSANITKGRLRKGLRACKAGSSSLQANNGGTHSSADPADLLIITHHIQKDKILALFDDAQRFNTVSAKAGFEGMPTFDGIPIHEDNQCTSSVLFIVDMRHTFLAVQVPPTFTAWGQQYNYDIESGFIKTYFNLVCTKPGNNYMVTSLATS